MKNLQWKLPLPMTDQDKAFMRNLLAVRAVRDKAVGKTVPAIVYKTQGKP
jgi:hypothetical protein